MAKDAPPLYVYIGSYADASSAEKVWRALKDLADNEVIFVEGLALVNRGEDGKVHVKDTRNEPGIGATIGAVGGAVLGLIFPPSLLVSAVVGTAVGAAAGTTLDRLSKRQIKSDVDWVVPPGGSGVVVVFHEFWAANVEKALAGATRIERHQVAGDDKSTVVSEDPRLA